MMRNTEAEDGLSSAYRKYETAAFHEHHVTVAESMDLARDLAFLFNRSGDKADIVVGLANGAFLPTKVVAETLQLPWHMIKVRRKGSRYKQRLVAIKNALRIPPELILWGPFRIFWVFFQNRTSALETSNDPLEFDVKGKHVLVVDDSVDTGRSIDYVKGRLFDAGALSVTTAAYCWAIIPKVDPDFSRPNIYLHRGTQIYPWSNNSRYFSEFEKWMSDCGLTYWK